MRQVVPHQLHTMSLRLLQISLVQMQFGQRQSCTLVLVVVLQRFKEERLRLVDLMQLTVVLGELAADGAPYLALLSDGLTRLPSQLGQHRRLHASRLHERLDGGRRVGRALVNLRLQEEQLDVGYHDLHVLIRLGQIESFCQNFICFAEPLQLEIQLSQLNTKGRSVGLSLHRVDIIPNSAWEVVCGDEGLSDLAGELRVGCLLLHGSFVHLDRLGWLLHSHVGFAHQTQALHSGVALQ
mmetsp:Transcript_6902/g.15304  ORF Transcript_6902/g.15304 Transcript_6902/m.15304 type:complete len:239 (+) Transcript_6902:501-1217(+)